MSPPPLLQFTLRDGTPIALRPIVPADRGRLLDGFEHLSETSRRLRFLGSVSSLSEAQLDYLTSTDGIDHVAWGTLDLSAPDAPGFGVGRWIRLDPDTHIAEFSLTVLDDMQGHGIGQLLLATLAVIAESLDVTVLRGYVGRENTLMVGWLQRLGASTQEEDSDLILDIPVPPDPTSSSSAAEFVALMKEIHDAVQDQRAGWDDEL
ncbi:MAG: hypothetical protein Rubg2KO_38850 [Rubricoccaceae bacterium]